ncbi:15331_t:CDS:2 [Gigaspora margarita]|uniref:15331_t:CDS:1 n=1 Tax=Gigaspora margarita TaxID=4874 RepID=A0ABN7VFH4_GIGMA|nr:15331_t:CDS:2 [Gigaspora margarita]
MPPSLKKYQQVTCSVSYLPTQGSLNSPDSSSLGSSGSPAYSLSVRYPLQEIQQQNDTKANFLEVIDNYLNIYVTRFEGNRKKKYLYKIFIGVKIRGTDIIAETRYDASDKGRKNLNLLLFLENQHCIPDELHTMLRITDVLFECLFLELLVKPTFNKKLKVNTDMTIQPETPKGRWHWTSLMGPDKLVILKNFPINSFIPGDEIRKLWDDFYFLYKTMRKINLTDDDIINFENLVRKWIKDFCKPTIETKEGTILQEGLYQHDDVTPYMHVLACHIPKFMKFLKTKNLYLRWFSCSGVEKKNHNHVQLFYGGTTMGGGDSSKPVAYEICLYENRQLYYYINEMPLTYSKKYTNF